MRDFVNEKARLLQPSGIRKFFDIVRETEGAISLGVGEPDFVTPWSVRSAAIASLQRGYTQYTANRGMPALLELIARYLETRFSLSFDPAHILLTVGASEGIDLLLRACVERGDEILIPDPAYVSYAPCALMADGTPVAVKCREENGFVPTAEDLEAAVTEKSKILILTYPNNPTGGIADRAALEKIASFAEKHDLLVISDEIYAELTYGQKHVSFASLPRMKERTAYVGGFSKAFAMTGWRLGYVCAPPAIDEAIFKIHQYSILCAPITAQYAAVEALKDGFSDDFAAVEEMRDSYDRRRRFVVDSLRGAGLSCFSPRGAFYAFPSVKNTSLSGEDFANLLLKEQKVAVVPGSAFGTFGRDNVRISYATGMTALTEACGRISEFMSKFR
ncbi:MAG: aminotransferase class I/II-fold pyridoxal phosphate-dependent enzyme [Christensenellaceae bacterium]|jgi:aspartate/tyrosine/aromatic aminotransferase|nr:aminotransferase class I/II-fold pyridoxal phosphate-dependent enzyme [Clostridia bacterium]PWM00528.1 MAG: pyridoxal phosphate-dependent aminotransferase [Clostridiales bacterium]